MEMRKLDFTGYRAAYLCNTVDDAQCLQTWERLGNPHMFTKKLRFEAPNGAVYYGLYDHRHGYKAIAKETEDGLKILAASIFYMVQVSDDIELLLLDNGDATKLYQLLDCQ